MSSFQGYAGTPGSEQAPNKSPSHVPDDFSTPNATVSTPIHQPPLSPTATPRERERGPDARADARRGAGAPADEEEESLRSRSRCRRRRSGTWRRSEGAQRLARLEAQRAAERTTPADPNLGTPGGESAGDEDVEDDDDDDDEDDARSEDEDDEEIDESLALAWRLQQEDDDRALLMALNGGREPPAGVTARNVSPSQMTHDQLMELGDNIGKVSKGAASSAVDALPTCKYCDAADHGAIAGDQCAICRMEFEPDDGALRAPCGHAEHAECLDQWLLINRSCPSARRTSRRWRRDRRGVDAITAPTPTSTPSYL
ncbi:ubiquitin-protein transferase [Aureococcus anophagefferens]|nr:ubiquitin-protein transferase [Aureococcus anophagefferens]